jgi:hypothetical protein
MSESEWQPIETAPKGIDILLYEPGIKARNGTTRIGGRIVVGRQPSPYPREATAWMPLPSPPRKDET